MALDTTSFAAALKILYPKGLSVLQYDNNPTLVAMPKANDFEGDYWAITLRYGNVSGGSASLSTAITNDGASAYTKFQVTRKKDYTVASLSGEVIDASASNKGAVIDALKSETDSAMNNFSRSSGTNLFGNGSGVRAQVLSGYAGNTVTLTNPDAIVGFEVGMYVQASATNTSASTPRTGTVQITGVDRDLGTLTIAGNPWNTQITSFVNGDYIGRAGDIGAMPVGIAGWVPASAPTNTPFFGVDRTADVTRLGGIRVTGSGAAKEETAVKAMTRVYREGGKPSHLVMNASDYQSLVWSLGAKVEYIREDGKGDAAGFGFEGIKLFGPTGPVMVYPDPNLGATGTAYLLQMNTWKRRSLGECPKFLMADGLKMLRGATTDTYQFRIGSYYNYGCDAPGYNANVAW